MLVRYDIRGAPYVGSGFLVNDRAVLTADHVACGARHRVVLDGRELPVQRRVRSGMQSVDLAVLVLKDQVAGIEPWLCARVHRGLGGKLSGCWAVGYPRRSKDQEGRVSRQVFGFIRPADGVPADSRADGAWLTLVGETAFWSDAPTDAESDWDSAAACDSAGADGTGASPWSGMSGAAVVKDGMVIGVVSRYHPAKGPETLTVTPLSALRLLPEGRQEEFCAALGLGLLDDLTVLTQDSGPGLVSWPGALAAQPPGTAPADPVAFSDAVRDRYAGNLLASGLPVPDRWDELSLRKLRHAHQERDATADVLAALCLAIAAKPVLDELDGHDIGIRKLQFLYRRHVGSWPACASRDEMLVLAAAASTAERRRAVGESGDYPEKVTALARFLLGIAGLQVAPLSAEAINDPGERRSPAPDHPTLDDPGLRSLADWLTGPMAQQRQDAEDYLATRAVGRTWALIELEAEESPRRSRPTGIVVNLISELGEHEKYRVECTASAGVAPEEAALQALRVAVATVVSPLPGKDVLVDLSLPRCWLDAGMEHWEVVPVDDHYEPLSRYYRPRLRWAMHQKEPQLRACLEKRARAVDWAADPEAIPRRVTTSRAHLEAWLSDRDQGDTRLPPFFFGIASHSGSHDPVGRLLSRGYGFTLWLTAQAAASAGDQAAHVAEKAARLSAVERREELPVILDAPAAGAPARHHLERPRGPRGLPAAAPRGGGTRRGGAHELGAIHWVRDSAAG